MLKPIKERQIPLPLPAVRTSLQRVLIPGFPAASPTAGSVSNWADPKWILCPSGEHMRTVQHFEDNVRWRKNMICWCIFLMYGCRYMYGIPAWCLESSKTVIWSARMWRFLEIHWHWWLVDGHDWCRTSWFHGVIQYWNFAVNTSMTGNEGRFGELLNGALVWTNFKKLNDLFLDNS